MQKLRSLRRAIRAADYNTKGIVVCLAAFLLLALALRYALFRAETFDYTNFLKPWMDYLSLHGLHSFHDNFANYNTPYLVLLWLGGHLPLLSDVAIVKGISIFFDLVLAAAVAMVVGYFRPKGYARYLAGLTTLFLPTVYLNSSLWGQCDAIYTSFVVWSFYFCLRDRSHWAWFMWGVAFAFKLQAIFFLPFLLFMLLNKRWKWYTPLIAGAAFCVLSALPILEGRPFMDTLQIYVNQAKGPTAGLPVLAWFSPTFYQHMPGPYFFTYLKNAGLMLGSAVATGIMSLAFRVRKYRAEELLVVCALCLFAVPYFLPQIHERYMFSAEIISLIVAFVLPRLAWTAVVMQVVSIITYNSYFSGGNLPPQISYPVLSLFVLAIIGALGWQLYSYQKDELPHEQGKSPTKTKP